MLTEQISWPLFVKFYRFKGVKKMEKIKLEEPIKVDGVLVHELSLRRPKVRDLLIASKKDASESEREVNLIANLAEISPEAIKDLDMRDYLKIQETLKDFLSPVTGTN
jgi:hypothetical protein